jgi:alcohol dehydrogenase
VVHGYAVALMLPHVMRFNAALPEVSAIYERFSGILRETGVSSLPLIEWVADLVVHCHISRVTVPAPDFELLAQDAARQWTGNFNPRPLQPADSVALYRLAFGNDGPI